MFENVHKCVNEVLLLLQAKQAFVKRSDISNTTQKQMVRSKQLPFLEVQTRWSFSGTMVHI